MEPTGQRLRRVAIELFALRGFHGTGIRDLAEAAGLSSATLYHYMGTKEELLASIMREGLHRLIAAGERTAAAHESPVDRLSVLVQLHVITHAERSLETRVVDDEMRALTEERRTEIVELRDRYEHLWQQAIDDGRAAGVFHVREPKVARLALLEMCGGIARWYTPTGSLALDDLALRYTEMALGLLGAAGPPPRPSGKQLAGTHALIDEIWAASVTAE
jgi:AcrR family transcriptional regulator